MILPYRAVGFAPKHGPALHGHRQLHCQWPHLIRAAITVGRPSWAEVLQHGLYSVLECTYRATMLWANLKASQGNPAHISKTTAYLGLDPSEKAAVSYFFGLAITKLVAERLLHAHWPQHLDRFAGLLTPTLSQRARPDFVARDHHGRWVVLEAKGRSNDLPAEVMAKAKSQTNAITSINGMPPYMRVAVGSYFKGPNLEAEIHDPLPEEQGRAVLNVSEEAFVRAYYKDALALFLASEQRREKIDIGPNLSFTTVKLPALDVTLGIADLILATHDAETGLHEAAFRVAKLVNRVEAKERARRLEGVAGSTSYAVGRDGILVVLGPTWSAEQMTREPAERSPLI